MLIAYCNDSILRVYKDVGDAVRDVEALDAEETFVQIFDDTANPYRIDWIRPNRESRFLWIRSVANGEYTLVVSGDRRPDELLSLIRSADIIVPPASEPRVRELERLLAAETGRLPKLLIPEGSVEMSDAPTYSFGSVDNRERYDHEYLLNCDRHHVVSAHAVVVTTERATYSAILGANGGGSGVHERSLLVHEDLCFVAVGSCVAALELPSLKLAWTLSVDSATCFGLHLASDQAALITHGELDVARVTFEGQILWTASGADIFSGDMVVSAGIVRVVDFEGRNYAFDEQSGLLEPERPRD